MGFVKKLCDFLGKSNQFKDSIAGILVLMSSISPWEGLRCICGLSRNTQTTRSWCNDGPVAASVCSATAKHVVGAGKPEERFRPLRHTKGMHRGKGSDRGISADSVGIVNYCNPQK